jgi:Uma2 family endonuclease
LAELLRQHFEDQDGLLAVQMKMIWHIPGLPEPAPDIAIIPGIQEVSPHWWYFDVVKTGFRPSLIIEIATMLDPEVRRQDYERKVEIYEQAMIPEYLIIAPACHLTDGILLLTGYRLGKDGRYQRISPDSEGRLLSETTGLLFGVEKDGQTLLILDSKNGERPLDFAENRARLAEERADQEMEARKAAEAENARLRLELERARQGSL